MERGTELFLISFSRLTFSQFLPEYAAVTDAAIGAGVKKAAWTMNNFAVVQEHRGRGIGRALLEAGEALVRLLWPRLISVPITTSTG